MEKNRKQMFEEAQRRAYLRQYLERRPRHKRDLAMRLSVLEAGLKIGERAIINRYR